jgi:hypothetical protein
MDQKKKTLFEIAFILLISAIVFLPNIGGLTYFKDDWYYIYDGVVGGAKVFHTTFSIDRPARGYFFELYFSLFGPHPLPYHIGAYLWRMAAALGALWLFNLLWQNQRRFAFFTTLLFVIYPGYFWWISAIEYQPMIASLAFQVFSIALTLKAIQAYDRVSKIAFAIGAILTGWVCILLVDYAIGIEAFRLLCVYIVVCRDANLSTLWKKISATLRVWAWNILIPLGYIVWRTFFFENERKATDVSLQLSGLFNAPVSTLSNWSLTFFSSIFNLSVLGWVAQIPRFFFALRFRYAAYGFLAAAAVILALVVFEKLLKRENEWTSPSSTNVYKESILIGMAGMVLGILPIIMANRYINIEYFSHYALPASLAAAAALAGLIHTLSSRQIQTAVLYTAIVFAVLSHSAISVNALEEENAIKEFWWQVSWRAPQIKPGTTFVIVYPLGNIGDDGTGVKEAPNLIYFPRQTGQIPVEYQVSALTLNNMIVPDLLVGDLEEQISRRSHVINYNYGNILVVSQPTPSSCAHVIDGSRPLLSANDPGNLMLIAPQSNIENVITDAQPAIPQEFAFGAEPEKTWCYYYQKAELALQMKNWDEAAALGEKAIRLELHPEDQSEWMPFLMAYAITGNDVRVKQTAPKITGNKFLRLEACKMLSSLQEPLNPKVQELADSLYCRNAK